MMLEPFPKIEGGFKLIVTDPPWYFRAGKEGRPQHYERMTDHEIAAMPVGDLAADDCWLMMWISSTMAYRPPRSKVRLRPDEIAERWGFHYAGRAFIWVKLHKRFGRAGVPLMLPRDSFHSGMGFTTRKNAEDVLLFKRGKPKRTSKSVNEMIVSPLREHSRKPDEFYERAERFCDGPRLEMFARKSRPGWVTWGNQSTLFDD